MSHLGASGAHRHPPLDPGPPQWLAPCPPHHRGGWYLRDHVLAGHEQGPQQVLAAVIPQGVDRNLGRGRGKWLRSSPGAPGGVCEKEGPGQTWLAGGSVCRDSTGAAAPTDETSLPPPRSPLLPLQTPGPTAGGHSPHTGRTDDDGPSTAQPSSPVSRARWPRPSLPQSSHGPGRGQPRGDGAEGCNGEKAPRLTPTPTPTGDPGVTDSWPAPLSAQEAEEGLGCCG